MLCTEQSVIRKTKVPYAIVVYRHRTRGAITKVSLVILRLPGRGEHKRLIAFAHGASELSLCSFVFCFGAMAEHSGKGTESKNPEELDEDIFWLQWHSKDGKGKGGRQGFSNFVFPIYGPAAVPDDDGQEHVLAGGGW